MAKDVIKVRCNVCGREWEPNAFSFSKTARCINCEPTSFRTHDEFVKIVEAFGRVKVIGKYINTSRKVKVECVTCGKIWDAPPHYLINGSGCKECRDAINVEKRKLTHEQFMEKVAPVLNVNIEIAGRYSGYSSKIRCICKKCGHVWDAFPSVLLRSGGCPNCAGILKTHEDFVDEISKIHPTINIISKYKTSKEPVQCECSVCGTRWDTSPSNLKIRLGCPSCSRDIVSERFRKPNEQFVDELKSISPTIELLEEYKSSKEPIKCKCAVCGYIWYPIPSNLLKGFGCLKCSQKRPKNERLVDDILTSNHIEFVPWKTFDDLFGVSGGKLSYDFYIPELRLLIEVQGEQHYRPVEIFGGEKSFLTQQEHDKRKREYAKQNNYDLVEIKYDEDVYKKLQTVLNLESVTTTGAAQ